MMLLPQPLGLGPNENSKPGYFGDSTVSPSPLVVSVSSTTHHAGDPTSQIYSAGEGCFIPGRMQSELPGLNMYAAPTGSSALSSPANYGGVPAAVGSAPGLVPPHYGSNGMDHSPYYSSLAPTYDMKPGGGDMWGGSYGQAPPAYYAYESNFGGQYPYDRYCGVDMNDGVRRKNATRESTNTLKAWLQEHKKNPYPTKGEKIMLAIITKMTLTQVSTWFANARRRLKKENKMTWVPKNRSNENSGSTGEKNIDGDEDDVLSQNQDSDGKVDADHSLDSDDSAEREVTGTTDHDITNTPYSRDSGVFGGEKSDDLNVSDQPEDNLAQKDFTNSYQPANDASFERPPLPAAETVQNRYAANDAARIWSPINENGNASSYSNKCVENPADSQLNLPSSFRASYNSDNFSSISRQQQTSSVVSPALMSCAELPGRVVECRYPSVQNWVDGVYNTSIPATPETDSAACHATSVERRNSMDGRIDERLHGVSSPLPDYHHQQFQCKQLSTHNSHLSAHDNDQYNYHTRRAPMDSVRSPVNNIPGQVAPPSYQMFGFNNQIQPFNTSDYYHDERLAQSTADARIGYYNPQRTTEPRQNMTVQANRLQSSNMYHPGETKASMLSSPSSASGSSPASRQLCQGESSVATRHIPSSYHDGSGMVVSASNPSAFHGNYYHMSGDQSDRVHTHIANNSSANNYMLGTSALDQRNMEASQGYQNVLNNQGPYSRSPRPPASPHTELIISPRDGEERRELQAAETLTNLSTR